MKGNKFQNETIKQAKCPPDIATAAVGGSGGGCDVGRVLHTVNPHIDRWAMRTLLN